MDEGSPRPVGVASSIIRKGREADAVRAMALNEQPCSDRLVLSGTAVDTGNGSRLEQLRPEQGLRRDGSTGASGPSLEEAMSESNR